MCGRSPPDVWDGEARSELAEMDIRGGGLRPLGPGRARGHLGALARAARAAHVRWAAAGDLGARCAACSSWPLGLLSAMHRPSEGNVSLRRALFSD